MRIIALEDKNGKYWLKFIGDTICSQCNKQIEDGDEIFIDAEDFFHKSNSEIEIQDICIYHHSCIIVPLKPDDYK